MELDIQRLTSHQRYKLMSSLIAPRPIALITTLSPGNVINAAPFSMFNMLGEDPPILMISINARDDSTLKDTAINIDRDGEFVVHMCDEPLAQKMHRCADPLPSNSSELLHAGFTAIASRTVRPPRIAEAPVAFECKLFEKIETTSRKIFIGEIHWLHVRDGLVNAQTCNVDLENYSPLGRGGGAYYVTTRNRFKIE